MGPAPRRRARAPRTASFAARCEICVDSRRLPSDERGGARRGCQGDGGAVADRAARIARRVEELVAHGRPFGLRNPERLVLQPDRGGDPPVRVVGLAAARRAARRTSVGMSCGCMRRLKRAWRGVPLTSTPRTRASCAVSRSAAMWRVRVCRARAPPRTRRTSQERRRCARRAAAPQTPGTRAKAPGRSADRDEAPRSPAGPSDGDSGLRRHGHRILHPSCLEPRGARS